MKRSLLVVALLLLLGNREAFAQSSFMGIWEVVAYKAGEIGEYSEKDAEAAIGLKVFISEDSTVLINTQCFDAKFIAREANVNEYLYYNYRAVASTLGIGKKSILVIEVYCGTSIDVPEYELMFPDQDTLIFPMGGYFFFLKRI
jgi:hypothetical protein